MDKKSGLVVLDFDDTLFFTRQSLKFATKQLLKRTDLDKAAIRKMPNKVKGKIYTLAYSKYKDYSKPNLALIKRLEELRRENNIIVLTARGPKLIRHTSYLINKHSIVLDGVYHRKNVNGMDEAWKMGQLKKYLKSYKHISLYEDKAENIEFIRRALGSKKISYYLVTKARIRKV